MTKERKIAIAFIAVIMIIIAIIVYVIIRKKKVECNYQSIIRAIDKGAGLLGTDIDSVLANVKCDVSYNVSVSDIKKLKSAKGSWYSVDHPEYIGQVFAGKRKSQIKCIINRFEAEHGRFNDHLNNIFDDLTGFDTSGYNNVLNIVRNAK